MLFIVYNLTLSFLLAYFLRDLKNKLFPSFLCIFEWIILETSIIPIFVYFDGAISSDNPNFIVLLNRGRGYKIPARKAAQEASKFHRMSRQLQIFAPIMDKNGHGDLQDVFQTHSKDYIEQSSLWWKEHDSLQNKGREIENLLGIAIAG